MKSFSLIALAMIFGTACETNDEFGNSPLRVVPAERLASFEYASQLIWYQNDKVLLSRGNFSVLDVRERSIREATEDFFSGVVGVTEDGIVIALASKDDGSLNLEAVDLEGPDRITLSTNIFQNQYSLPILSFDNVFYTEIDSDSRQFIYRYNLTTKKRSALIEDAVAIAVSPDKTKLLYVKDHAYMTYDLAGGTHNRINFVEGDPMHIAWTDVGILGYFYVPTESDFELHIRDLQTKSLIVQHDGLADWQLVTISRDGKRYVYPTALCDPDYDCYDQSVIVINEGELSGGTREIARFESTPESVTAGIGKGAYAPDASSVIFNIAGGIYQVSLAQ